MHVSKSVYQKNPKKIRQARNKLAGCRIIPVKRVPKRKGIAIRIKRKGNTMKTRVLLPKTTASRRWIALACFMSIFTATVLLGSFAMASGYDQHIDEAEAKSIALDHAGVSEEQVAFVSVHLDYDDGRAVYDVEFYSGNTEYDYEINAVNGNIREFDHDFDNHSIPRSSKTSAPARSSSSDSGAYIGEAKAESIALNHAGVSASQAQRMRVKLDRKHGSVVYEVDFNSGRMEYEYEIDAVSGKIRKADADYDD